MALAHHSTFQKNAFSSKNARQSLRLREGRNSAKVHPGFQTAFKLMDLTANFNEQGRLGTVKLEMKGGTTESGNSPRRLNSSVNVN